MTFEQRCRVSEKCLPEAPYREMLTKLHNQMLEALAQPAPVQEPDDGDELTIAYMSGLHKGKELAPQRTWVGLTDEEVDILHRISMDIVDAKGWGFLNHERFAKNIEAKLKEKNA